MDIGHFCNYLYTLYHILNVDVQGQASSTSCHKGHRHPSCQHSSGGVSVLFLINPVLQPWPCTSVQQLHGGYLAPYHCVLMLLAQPDSVMSRPAHPPVLCSPSLQSSRICSPTVFLAIAHSPAQRLTAGRAWHRLGTGWFVHCSLQRGLPSPAPSTAPAARHREWWGSSALSKSCECQGCLGEQVCVIPSSSSPATCRQQRGFVSSCITNGSAAQAKVMPRQLRPLPMNAPGFLRETHLCFQAWCIPAQGSGAAPAAALHAG